MIVDPRVVEIIDRFPALARRHLIRFERAIEILGAVPMARIADIVIIAAVAGGGEEVMPPDRVLDDFHQRLEVEAEHLGE